MSGRNVDHEAEFDPLPYELRLGVTGHCEFQDRDAVLTAVNRLVDHLERTFSDQRTPLAWTIVSSLAPGADQIVVERVLRQPESRLYAILPVEAEIYRSETAVDGRKGFDELFKAAEGVHIVDASLSRGSSEGSEASGAVPRSESYREAGRQVVDACEFLVAVWDGRPAQGDGGTAEAVSYARKRGRTVLWIDARNPNTEPTLLRGAATLKVPENPNELSADYSQLSAYNGDAVTDRAKWRTRRREDTDRLLRMADAAGLPREHLQPIVKHLLPHFVRADMLAVRYRRKHVGSIYGLFSLSAVAVSIVTLQVLFFADQPQLAASLEVAALAAAVVWFLCSRWGSWHDRWLDHRYLAERLRMAAFTLLVDSPNGPRDAAHTLPFYEGPDRWLISAYRTVAERVAAVRTERPSPEALKRFLRDGWMVGQRDWHARTAANQHRRARRLHWFCFALFVVTLASAVMHGLPAGNEGSASHRSEARRETDPGFHGAVAALCILLPTWGAAVHAMNTQLENERIAQRSKRMSQFFDRHIPQLESAPDGPTLAAIVESLERVVETENREWAITLGYRPPVLPA